MQEENAVDTEQQELPEEMIVKTEVIERVFQLLSQQPYAQVAQIMNDLQKGIRPFVEDEGKITKAA